ncbi:9997_t:CDS:2, partial [Funneliformis caledonium]
MKTERLVLIQKKLSQKRKEKEPILIEDKFKNDCELLMNEGEFHSNKVSESDNELALKERSRHACDLLCLSDNASEKISYYDNSKLPEEAPKWSISRSYGDDYQLMIYSN